MEISKSAGALATKTIEKALAVHQPVVDAYVTKARKWRPDGTPSDVVRALEKQYIAAVAAMGTAAGATAAAPVVGTGVALAINLAEVGTFLETSALFCLAVAEIHGVSVEDLERRRTLVLGILLGNAGTEAVTKVAGKTGSYWAKNLVKAIPMDAINAVNRVLGPRFVAKYGTRQGVLVLGRELPLGFGAAIGGAGNTALGWATVRNARRAFGPAPAAWSGPDLQQAPLTLEA
jgi:hypothetical protein